MHSEAERVAEAVHEVFSAGRLFGCVFGDVILREQAEHQELLVHVELCGPLPIARGDPRSEPGRRGAEHAEHRVVHGPLPRREAAAHGIGAGEVGAVIRIARPDVDQHEVARATLGVVVEIVQHAGVLARGHDRLVAHSGPAPGELPEQLGLEVVLHHARLHHRQHAAEAGVGDVDRLADQVDLGRALHGAKLSHQRSESLEAMQGIASDQLPCQTRVAGLHVEARPFVLVGVEQHPLALTHQCVQGVRQIGEPADLGHAGDRRRLVLRELAALPDRERLARLPHEEHLAAGRVGGIGGEHEHALLLLDAGQVEEIGGGHEPERAVAVRGQDVGGVDDDEASRRKHGSEVVAVGSEHGGIDRSMTHGGIVRCRHASPQGRPLPLREHRQDGCQDLMHGAGKLRLRSQLLAQADQHESLEKRVPIQACHVTLRGE